MVMLLAGSLLKGQQTISFTYGDDHQYFGNVRISLVLIGEKTNEKDPLELFLNRTNSVVDCNDFENVKLVLRIYDLNFAQFDHNFAYHLELPVNDQYISAQPLGLNMLTTPQTFQMGSDQQKEWPKTMEIEYLPQEDLQDYIEGGLSVSFKIIDKKGTESLVNPSISFEYQIVPEGAIQERQELIGDLETTPPVLEVEIDRGFEEKSKQEVKQVSYMSENIAEEENFENYSDNNETQFPSSTVKVNNNLNLYAELTVKGGQMEIRNISNGFPSFALAFYNSNEYRQKVYTLKLGSATSFKINMAKLPLESGEYFMELLDQKGQSFQVKEPIILTNPSAQAGIIGLPWQWIGVVAGVLIIIGTMVTFYLQREGA